MKPFNEKMSLQALLVACDDHYRTEFDGPCLFRLHDGEEWATELTDKKSIITEASNSTGDDYLHVYSPDGEHLGWFRLIWGNCPTGEELVADHVDNEFCEEVWQRHARLYE